MDDIAAPEARAQTRAKSVQDHIDELPIWADGTRLKSAPMTGMQWLIWSLAAAGKFFEGFVVFMTGVALPLLSREFGIGPGENGLITAATLFGILVGAVGLGGLSDRFGRKIMFLIEMVIFCAFLVGLVFAPNFYLVVICLFGIGLALGCDYPTAHIIISENIPSTARGKLVLGAFAFQAIGALAGTAVGYFVLSTLPDLPAWRWMFASAIIPAVLVTLGRVYIVESANWLHARGAIKEAEHAATKLLVRQAAISERNQTRAARQEGGGKSSVGAELCVAVQRSQSARDHSRFGSLVPAGPWNLRHRHLHSDDPGRRRGGQ
jgi:putative MFS transporter